MNNNTDKTEYKIKLRSMFFQSEGVNHNEVILSYASWLEDRMFEMQKQPKTEIKVLKKALEMFTDAVENEDVVMYDNLDHDGRSSTPNKIYNEAKKALKQNPND